MAQALGLRTKQGPVFSDISFVVEPGQLICLGGPAGTGRSALALTCAGRMRFSDGEFSAGGRSLPAGAAWLRKNSVMAPGGAESDFEEGLRVREEINRSRWLAGKHVRTGFGDPLEFAGLTQRGDAIIRSLTTLERDRLAISCGFIEDAKLVVIDDVGAGIPAAAYGPLWQQIAEGIRRTGATVLATCLELETARDYADHLVALKPEAHTDDATTPEPLEI